MRYINTLVSDTFEDETRVYTLVNTLRHPVVQTVYLQVSEADDLESVTIYGATTEDEEFASLSAVSMSEFEKVSEITEAGIYHILAEELSEIKITIEGTALITLKVIE